MNFINFMSFSDFSYKKPLSKPFDVMIINHFILYFIFGYYYPNNYILVLILSILWELFEIFVTSWDYTYSILKEKWVVPERYWNEKPLHKVFDILVNLLGYTVGSYYGIITERKKAFETMSLSSVIFLYVIHLTRN